MWTIYALERNVISEHTAIVLTLFAGTSLHRTFHNSQFIATNETGIISLLNIFCPVPSRADDLLDLKVQQF